ncbi:MAG: SRPBCC family protein [Alphaproteobacteria bacterium]|nr:SRPBCC family protein [Alphaproteobacteria bacterium]MBN9592977.1 SRPBCC family protein [Alphaproteobacteria bacterium]
MSTAQFVYVIYIRTTPQKLWDALTNPEFQKQYWFGMHQESEWKAGSPWKLLFSDGRVADAGEVLESDPPRRLVLSWQNQFKPELTAEGHARCVYDIEADGDVVRLTITHSIDREGAKLIEAVSGGWPRILSSLKSLLETGTPIPSSHQGAGA